MWRLCGAEWVDRLFLSFGIDGFSIRVLVSGVVSMSMWYQPFVLESNMFNVEKSWQTKPEI